MKANLSLIMKAAWAMVREFNYSMSEALKAAWANAKVRARLANGTVRFTFKKLDGTIREAIGTLAAHLIPATSGTRTSSSKVQSYFDLEKGEWRCYRLERILNIY